MIQIQNIFKWYAYVITILYIATISCSYSDNKCVKNKTNHHKWFNEQATSIVAKANSIWNYAPNIFKWKNIDDNPTKSFTTNNFIKSICTIGYNITKLLSKNRLLWLLLFFEKFDIYSASPNFLVSLDYNAPITNITIPDIHSEFQIPTMVKVLNEDNITFATFIEHNGILATKFDVKHRKDPLWRIVLSLHDPLKHLTPTCISEDDEGFIYIGGFFSPNPDTNEEENGFVIKLNPENGNLEEAVDICNEEVISRVTAIAFISYFNSTINVILRTGGSPATIVKTIFLSKDLSQNPSFPVESVSIGSNPSINQIAVFDDFHLYIGSLKNSNNRELFLLKYDNTQKEYTKKLKYILDDAFHPYIMIPKTIIKIGKYFVIGSLIVAKKFGVIDNFSPLIFILSKELFLPQVAQRYFDSSVDQLNSDLVLINNTFILSTKNSLIKFSIVVNPQNNNILNIDKIVQILNSSKTTDLSSIGLDSESNLITLGYSQQTQSAFLSRSSTDLVLDNCFFEQRFKSNLLIVINYQSIFPSFTQENINISSLFDKINVEYNEPLNITDICQEFKLTTTTTTFVPTSPTDSPTPSPTPYPTNPTDSPTPSPTPYPTNPTDYPTLSPTNPTPSPTPNPTNFTDSPTPYPTPLPSNSPTEDPTSFPTQLPTSEPTDTTDSPTESPTFNFTTTGTTGNPTNMSIISTFFNQSSTAMAAKNNGDGNNDLLEVILPVSIVSAAVLGYCLILCCIYCIWQSLLNSSGNYNLPINNIEFEEVDEESIGMETGL